MTEKSEKDEINSEGSQGIGADMSFEKLVRENIGWMLSLANRMLRDKAQAEDAVQNAFANIHKGLDGFENRSALRTWMHRIVVNEALMILRKTDRLKEQPLDGLLPQFDDNSCRIVEGAITWETPETKLTMQQTLVIVRKEVSLLPEAYGLILLLRDIEGIPTAEVAEMLDVSEANVRVRLHRARAALKKRLEPLIAKGAL